MKCYVYSHKDFDALCMANGWNDNCIPCETAFISICCTDGSEEHWFKMNHANVINLDFDDILDEEVETFRGISDSQAEELYKFIMANQGKDFFIHCSAGKSRSQAVCKAITTMFPGYETRPDNPCLYPNVFVSNKLLRLSRDALIICEENMITIDYTNKTVGIDFNVSQNVDEYIDHYYFYRVDDDMFPYQGTRVWSIFDSFVYPEPNDSKPLENVFDKKDGWVFRSAEDKRLFEKMINRIAKDFTTDTPFWEGRSNITFFVLEDNAFNNYVVRTFSLNAKSVSSIINIDDEYEKINGNHFVIVGDAIKNEQIIHDLIQRVNRLCTPESITIVSQFFRLIHVTNEEVPEWIRTHLGPFPVEFNKEKDIFEIFDRTKKGKVIATLPSNPLRSKCWELYDFFIDNDL